MDLKSVDLNLLVVFDAVFEHRGVTRAGEAVGLSQPAMSAALSRLRSLFDDPLFVRSGAEMKPTPTAQMLAPAVRSVMDTIRSDILRRGHFDPLTTTRLFTVLTPDIGEVHCVPPMLQRLAELAPHAHLRTLAFPRTTAAEALESGEADLALGYFPDLHRAGFFQQKLFVNPHCCLMRHGHPLAQGKLTLKQYLGAEHAVVRPAGREHVLERFLHERGLTRRVVVELSHFMSLLPVIELSDVIATVPKDLADLCCRHGRLQQVDTPFKSPVTPIHQSWHRRFHHDSAVVWLRSVVHGLFAAT